MQDVERRKQKDEFSYLLSDLSMIFTAHSRNQTHNINEIANEERESMSY